MPRKHTPASNNNLTPEQEQLRQALDENTEYPWQDDQILLICTNPVPNHPAYGMTFSEYKKHRNDIISSDDKEKVRLSVRLPVFIARVSADMALRNKVSSHYRFLVLILELGMINFQKDYHEKYQIIKSGRNDMYVKLNTGKNQRLYEQLDKQSIDMCFDMRKAKHMTPTVAEWLANSANDIATYLNMNTTDFAFLCWCIGVSKTMDDGDLPLQVKLEINKRIQHFDQEITFYSDRIIDLVHHMDL
jgi:hypothetical protein